ncbi:glycosyltransferase [Paenibacillus doosanensis]|uniref:MGDG synthase family glycosyltransferase n=1 Tax=Paenibacillus doosanensis TaxID=1229154 RepID=UPI00217FD473|nr:glycosyltransferase [Paenibacillus doosanensis]MCS7464108.1 glycosyltransferase [Paenibacillus doosanensis]
MDERTWSKASYAPSNPILILSGNYGDGHRQAAQAILEAVKDELPGAEPMLVDYMELTHPFIHPLGRYLFLESMKKMPRAYGYVYGKTRSAQSFSGPLKWFQRRGSGRLAKLLQTVRPSIVISTFPLAAGAMSALKAGGQTDAHTATVVTDHTDHSYWVYPHTDTYIVGSRYVKRRLQTSYDIPARTVCDTGIPIRKAFGGQYDREQLRRRHGLDPALPALLFMGGGGGLLGGSSHLKALEELPFPVQYWVVCGRNDALKRQLAQELRHSKHRVHIEGFVEHIHELMGAADMMITKPGGLTISEGLAMELPMLLYKPLPGQEEDNARFLLGFGAADAAGHPAELAAKISDYLQHPEKLRRLRANAAKLQRKAAAREAVRVIMQARLSSDGLRSPAASGFKIAPGEA